MTSRMGIQKSHRSSSLEETIQIGRALAKDLQADAVVCFFGDLGSGKTTLIKALASHLTGIHPHEVSSPTFNYLHIYEGEIPIFHFDLYRLQNHKEFLERGFNEYFEASGICCIEWAERIQPILPNNAICIEMKHLSKNERGIQIS